MICMASPSLLHNKCIGWETKAKTSTSFEVYSWRKADAALIEGPHFHCVLLTTVPWGYDQLGLCGVIVSLLLVAVWDHCDVSICISLSVPAHVDTTRSTVHRGAHICWPTWNWTKRRRVGKGLLCLRLILLICLESTWTVFRKMLPFPVVPFLLK